MSYLEIHLNKFLLTIKTCIFCIIRNVFTRRKNIKDQIPINIYDNSSHITFNTLLFPNPSQEKKLKSYILKATLNKRHFAPIIEFRKR